MNTQKSSPFLSISEYKPKYSAELDSRTLTPYFDSLTVEESGYTKMMIKFCKEDYVPGGAWPGDYGLFTVIDYTKLKLKKGKKKVFVSESEYNFVDSPDMNDLVPYELPTTAELIESERKRAKHSIYNIPGRLRKEYVDKLIVTINGTRAQGSELTEDMLEEAISKMTTTEYAYYLRKINNIDIDLYPTVELPIKVRICGVDDGAVEAQFGSMDEYEKVFEYMSLYVDCVSRQLLQDYFRFKWTD